MTILKILLVSLSSIIVLFLLTKLIGNRQMSQMSMFDYINGITIGSIAAEMATSLEGDWLKPLLAMALYALVAAAISLATCKSMALRKLFNGKPIVLYENGKLYEKNLLLSRLDINEFLTQCRVAGYFNLADVQSAILETNGQVSFLPCAASRPVNPKDLQLTPLPEAPMVNVIIDGHVLLDNLHYTGNDETWLKNELAHLHAKTQDVFLACCDHQNVLTVYRKTGEQIKREIFE